MKAWELGCISSFWTISGRSCFESFKIRAVLSSPMFSLPEVEYLFLQSFEKLIRRIVSFQCQVTLLMKSFLFRHSELSSQKLVFCVDPVNQKVAAPLFWPLRAIICRNPIDIVSDTLSSFEFEISTEIPAPPLKFNLLNCEKARPIRLQNGSHSILKIWLTWWQPRKCSRILIFSFYFTPIQFLFENLLYHFLTINMR